MIDVDNSTINSTTSSRCSDIRSFFYNNNMYDVQQCGATIIFHCLPCANKLHILFVQTLQSSSNIFIIEDNSFLRQGYRRLFVGDNISMNVSAHSKSAVIVSGDKLNKT